MYSDRLLFCLHGFLRTGVSMWWMSNTLADLGHKERYTPTFGLHLHSLEHNAQQLHRQIVEAVENTGAESIDVVTYSMGGLLIRAVLTLYPNTPINTLVMIAPPNQGAEMAEFVRRWVPLHEMGWDPLSPLLPNAPERLNEPPINIPVGVIAGQKGNGVGYTPFLSEDNDGKVCLGETKLQRPHEWIAVKGRHASLILHPLPIRKTKLFLKQLSFVEH